MTVIAAQRAMLKTSNTIAVGSGTGATVNQNLRGGLHPFGWPVSTASGATAETNANGLVNWQRTDKLLTCTPIKAGAVDGTHPTLGHSGLYSYDWQVVDRALADIAAQGATPYLSLDSNVTLLGGTTPPYSGSTLTSQLPAYGGFDNSVPNDLNAYATMCVDLIHHITVEKGVSVPYWGVGNEPDISEFWTGTSTQFFQHFAAISAAVKTYNPALKVGGPELNKMLDNFTAWVQGLLSYCVTNSVVCDFVSLHDYTTVGWALDAFMTKLVAAKTAVGWSTPLEVIVGEGAGVFGGNNSPIFTGSSLPTLGDMAAAYDASQLMEMQRLGVSVYIRFKPNYESGSGDTNPFGLFNATGPYASGNVWKLWSMLGTGSVLATTVSADPGIRALAVSNGGKTYVLLTNLHYRRGTSYPVAISGISAVNGTATTLYAVDQFTSNQFDAGAGNAALATQPITAVQGGIVTLTMQARSVCMVVVG